MNARKLKKKHCFFKNRELLTFEEKKMDRLKALWVCRTIYDGQFFFKINPIWENWINRWHYYFASNSDNYFPFSKSAVDRMSNQEKSKLSVIKKRKNHKDLYKSTFITLNQEKISTNKTDRTMLIHCRCCAAQALPRWILLFAMGAKWVDF